MIGLDGGRDQDELRSKREREGRMSWMSGRIRMSKVEEGRGRDELDAGKDQNELRSKKGGGGMSWMKGGIRMS